MKSVKVIIILVFILFASCSKIVIRNVGVTSPWPQFGSNAAHTNFTNQNLTPPLKQVWQHRASSALGNSIVVLDGIALFGTKDGRIEGVRIEDGKKAGRIKIKRNIPSTIAAYKNKLLIARRIEQPTFEMYDVSKGKSIWKQKAKGIFGEPLIVGNMAVISDLTSRLLAISLADGSELWNYKLESKSDATAAYSNGIIVIGDDSGTVNALDESGKVLWKFQADRAIRSAASISNNTVYIGSTNGTMYALDLQSGELIWSYESNDKIYNAAAISELHVVFGTTGHKVYCLNKQNGELEWTFEAKSLINTAPVIAGKVVYIGSLDKFMYGLDLSTGEKVWAFEARGRIISNPIVVNNHLLFASQNDRLYCFTRE